VVREEWAAPEDQVVQGEQAVWEESVAPEDRVVPEE